MPATKIKSKVKPVKLSKRLQAIAKLVVTPEAERSRMLRQHALDYVRPPSEGDLWAHILAETSKKLKGINGKLSGELELSYCHSRPVLINYLDTKESEELWTLPQMALVGRCSSTTIGATLTQVWVGRVFPQWKSRHISLL
jgi:hypothetical protein